MAAVNAAWERDPEVRDLLSGALRPLSLLRSAVMARGSPLPRLLATLVRWVRIAKAAALPVP